KRDWSSDVCSSDLTFGVSWNRGSTCFMSLLRILGIKISCWFATGLQARNRAGDRRGFRLGRLCARQIRQPPRATAPAAQGNYASRRRTGRVRILLSLESIRTRPQLEEDTSKRTRPASASGESPQHSTTLTARPPSAVSLYFEDISAPVWRIVSITSSRLTRCWPSPHSAIRAALMALPAAIAL